MILILIDPLKAIQNKMSSRMIECVENDATVIFYSTSLGFSHLFKSIDKLHVNHILYSANIKIRGKNLEVPIFLSSPI